MHTKKQKNMIRAVGIVAIIMILMGFILPYLNLAVKA